MARSFVSASSQYIELTTVDFSQYATMSFSCWYKGSTAGSTFVFNHNESGGTFKGPYVRPRNAGGNFEIGMGDTAGNITLYTCTRPSDNAWHHIMGTWERSSKVLRAWFDGVEQTLSASLSGTFTGNFPSGILRIARYSGGQYLDGSLADLAWWGNILFKAGEASRLSKFESPLTVRPEQLILFLPLDGTQGSESSYAKFGELYGPTGGLTVSGAGRVAHPFGHRTVTSRRRKVLA